MTSILLSIFDSGSWALAKQMESMRDSEQKLASLARRFEKNGDNKNHELEIYDTHIPQSSVPSLLDGKCLLYPPSDDVTIEDESLLIHGVRVTSSNPPSSNPPPPLVLLHGYGNGSLYFYRNLFGLCTHHFRTVYALDLLGWGLSSRPPFLTRDESVESAESVFCESLEAWRKANDIPKMILGGHSMGGYLSVAYCERYPTRVERLILISPVGVPEEGENPKPREGISIQYRLIRALMRSLWLNGIPPSSFLRFIPESRGRKCVEVYFDSRIPALTCPEEKDALTNYLYTNAILPGSGEYCLTRLLKPFAFAKAPLLHRIPKLQIHNITFLYGEKDWMDSGAALDVQRRCREIMMEGNDSRPACHCKDGEENGRIVPCVEVYGVRRAGHLLMLENWEEFNTALVIAGGGEKTLPDNVSRPFRIESKTKLDKVI